MERNHEHYPDGTCGKALKHIEQDEYRCTLGRMKRALKQAKRIFQDHGFEVFRPIVLRDKATGRNEVGGFLAAFRQRYVIPYKVPIQGNDLL